MAKIANPTKSSLLPSASSQEVRQCWLDLLDLSYSTRRVTRQEIEPGVNAIVVPAICRSEVNKDLLDAEVRMAMSHVPNMARGVRLELSRLGEFELALPEVYGGWMGQWGKDIAAGATQVTVLVDLAYLEAALLDRLWNREVLVEFSSPLAMFRRGSLIDYANVYEAVVTMAAAGSSLADTAARLAAEVLDRLQIYANTYHQLSSLYTQAVWRIDDDNFKATLPASRLSLALQYWQLRDAASAQKVRHEWRNRIEKFFHQAAAHPNPDFPKSFAA